MVKDTRERFNPDKLRVFSSKILQKLGVPKEDADITADMLVACDLRGVESHGIAHLHPEQFYCKWIKDGLINVTPNLKTESRTPTTATMDGDQGLGFVVGYRAMSLAIEKAKESGSGFVNVTNSTHFGATAYYTMMAMEHDMIGVAMTSTVPSVVAPGTAEPVIGTNPLAIAIPAGKKPPFVLDMATSVVAGGKVQIAKRQGKTMPEGWVIDGEGKPITDPEKKVQGDGGLLPLGGTPAHGIFKGFGLGIVVDVLTCLLAGLDFTLLKERGPGENPSDFFFGAIRIDGFQTVELFKEKMDNMIEKIESLPTLPGVEKAYVAGGYEGEVIIPDRTKNGIPLDPPVMQGLKDLAEQNGVEFDIK
jgi:L-2-hydroxycarboxylate dehydrogenase (NAD+)